MGALVAVVLLVMIVLALPNRLHVNRNMGGIDIEVLFRARMSDSISSGVRALPALMLPVLILGGIYGGIVTPTEAAAIALVYAIPVGLFVYRELTLRKIAGSVVQAATTTGVIMIILVSSFVASRIFTLERIPQQLTDFLIGTFISPLMAPVMAEIGVDPIHFAAIIGTSVVIGANSPPMAPILFTDCRAGGVGMSEVIKPALYFMAFAAFPVMLVTSYWSPLALFLPRLLGSAKRRRLELTCKDRLSAPRTRSDPTEPRNGR